MLFPIVYPLHSKGGKLQNDTELKLSLRSLARHLEVPFQVVIAGESLPSWATNIELIHVVGGLKAALRAVSEAFPDGFFWIYDDCCLLRDTDAELLKITPACKGWPQIAKTNWAGMLNEIHERLSGEGISAIDYSRPHGPYWFDKGMVDEGFADWPGMSGKFPWESWILSKRGWPKRHGVVKQYYGHFNAPPAKHHYFLNYNDKGNTVELRRWLRSRFAEPSPFELQTVELRWKWERIFFVHIPKTAGKAVLEALGDAAIVENPGRHREWTHPSVENAWKREGRAPVVACVRNPMDRAVSVYRYFLQTDFPRKDEPHRVLKELFRLVGFSRFWGDADVGHLSTVIKHLRPQANFIFDAPVDMLLKYETLDGDFATLVRRMGLSVELPCVNVSRGEMPSITPAAKAKIEAFYRIDYECYYPHLLRVQSFEAS